MLFRGRDRPHKSFSGEPLPGVQSAVMERTAATHPRRFTLERLVAEDLPQTEADSTRAHVDGCSDCRAVLDALRADLARFQSEVPYAAFRVEHERRKEARAARPLSRRV